MALEERTIVKIEINDKIVTERFFIEIFIIENKNLILFINMCHSHIL
jgi:hypothetical protein